MSFICAKEMLESIRPLVSSLQGELMEIYLGFKKIDQVIESYQLIRDDIDSWFNQYVCQNSSVGRKHRISRATPQNM